MSPVGNLTLEFISISPRLHVHAIIALSIHSYPQIILRKPPPVVFTMHLLVYCLPQGIAVAIISPFMCKQERIFTSQITLLRPDESCDNMYPLRRVSISASESLEICITEERGIYRLKICGVSETIDFTTLQRITGYSKCSRVRFFTTSTRLSRDKLRKKEFVRKRT